jgi:uncharacterized protein
VLSYLFGSRLRARLLGFLMTHPDEWFHVRRISTALDDNSTNVSRELKRLSDFGILDRIVEGRRISYRANARCPIYPELHSLAVKTTGLCDLLRAALNPFLPRIRAAFVYGSFAEGREHASSDVDVVIIGDLTAAEAVRAFRPVQNTIGREINPVIYPPDDFSLQVAGNHPFLTRVISGNKLFVIGDADELAGMARQPLAV